MLNHRLLFVMMIVVSLLLQSGGMRHASAGTFIDCANVIQIPVAECNALVALYNSTNGAAWTNNANWLVTDIPGDWYGVTVTSGFVTNISLRNNNRSGTIPAQLSNLTKLEYLALSTNQLNGVIPPELGNLTNLNYIELMSDQLNGVIPSEVGNLLSLQYLNLSSNQLSGNIPPQLGDLHEHLHVLYLDHNQLSGSIPHELGYLYNLQWLYLSANLLSGTIPPELGNISNLEILYISNNQISGSIPSQLGNPTYLQKLGLGGNQLSGSVPSELSKLTNLDYLWLAGNLLSGAIPLSFTSLTSLITFNVTNTWLCEPHDSAFQAWKSSVTNWSSPGLCYSINGQVLQEGNPFAGVAISDGGVHSTLSQADGTYAMLDLPPQSYTLAPTFAGYTFIPHERSVTITDTNISGQDFRVARNVFLPLLRRN